MPVEEHHPYIVIQRISCLFLGSLHTRRANVMLRLLVAEAVVGWLIKVAALRQASESALQASDIIVGVATKQRRRNLKMAGVVVPLELVTTSFLISLLLCTARYLSTQFAYERPSIVRCIVTMTATVRICRPVCFVRVVDGTM